jgi:hypothetical protein
MPDNNTVSEDNQGKTKVDTLQGDRENKNNKKDEIKSEKMRYEFADDIYK